MTALSGADREMLKAVHRRARTDDEVRTTDLAAALDLAPATVTARVQRLADRGLLGYTPYQGVHLTDEGERAAVAAIRRHRIVERFLCDLLGFSWDEAGRLALPFEHDLPDEVVERLHATLGRPDTCPHGFPIPAADADDLPYLPLLPSLAVGDEAVVAIPEAVDPDVLAFLEGLGVRPGARVTVEAVHPFEGPVEVRVGGDVHTIGNRVARLIRARPVR